MVPELETVQWARRLKVRHLECFLLLEESGTLSEAANRMHMTQSAMSHWLSELESLVGVRLAARGRRIELTDAGKALRRLATRVLGDVSRTHDELALIAAGAAPSIHIGSITAGVAHLLPRAIAQFQQGRPEVTVRISEASLNPLLEGLEKKELDVLVGSVDTRAYGPHLSHEVLFEETLVAITGTGHPLVKKEGVTWSDLFDYPWLMPPPGTLMRARLEAILLNRGGAGIRPRVETGSVTIVETLLAQTDYVAAWSASVARHWQSIGAIHILELSDWYGPVGAVWRKGEQQPEVEQFMDCLRAVGEEMQTGIAAEN